MAYNTMNPGMNPMNPGMMAGHEHKDFNMLMSEISTYLWEGEAWHEKAANECRKLALRGFGRWHEAEGCYDAKERYCLDKLMRDKLDMSPMVDIAKLDRALQYMMTGGADGLKAHFHMWMEREHAFIDTLNAAIKMSGEIDMEIYKKLCCLVDEVQNESMRVKMVEMRLAMAGYNGHDLGVTSMVLHKYFECEYDGGKIDFNLG